MWCSFRELCLSNVFLFTCTCMHSLWKDKRQFPRDLNQLEKKIASLGPVHTNAISFENSYISMRLGLPSSQICWAFSSKTHRLENALKSGSKQKRLHIRGGRSKTHQNENDDRKYRRRLCFYHSHRVQLTSERAILSFSNVLIWTVKNASKR